MNGNDNEKIINCGYINRNEVFENMKTKVLIFPSYIETVGLPLLEAKLIGTIILASNTPFSMVMKMLIFLIHLMQMN